jgi:hypothetical protein
MRTPVLQRTNYLLCRLGGLFLLGPQRLFLSHSKRKNMLKDQNTAVTIPLQSMMESFPRLKALLIRPTTDQVNEQIIPEPWLTVACFESASGGQYRVHEKRGVTSGLRFQ